MDMLTMTLDSFIGMITPPTAYFRRSSKIERRQFCVTFEGEVFKYNYILDLNDEETFVYFGSYHGYSPANTWGAGPEYSVTIENPTELAAALVKFSEDFKGWLVSCEEDPSA